MAARLGKKGIYGMNIFTKNMFLAEDRYVSPNPIDRVCLGLSLVEQARGRQQLNMQYPLLRASRQGRGQMGLVIRQAQQGRDGRA